MILSSKLSKACEKLLNYFMPLCHYFLEANYHSDENSLDIGFRMKEVVFLPLQNLFFMLQDDTILSLLLSCMMSLLCSSQVQIGIMLFYSNRNGAVFMIIHGVKGFSQSNLKTFL